MLKRVAITSSTSMANKLGITYPIVTIQPKTHRYSKIFLDGESFQFIGVSADLPLTSVRSSLNDKGSWPPSVRRVFPFLDSQGQFSANPRRDAISVSCRRANDIGDVAGSSCEYACRAISSDAAGLCQRRPTNQVLVRDDIDAYIATAFARDFAARYGCGSLRSGAKCCGTIRRRGNGRYRIRT